MLVSNTLPASVACPAVLDAIAFPPLPDAAMRPRTEAAEAPNGCVPDRDGKNDRAMVRDPGAERAEPPPGRGAYRHDRGLLPATRRHRLRGGAVELRGRPAGHEGGRASDRRRQVGRQRRRWQLG